MTGREVTAALAEPFAADRIGWKAQATSKDGNKALAVAYIDARDVMDRLDEVVGAASWQTSFEVLADGNVVCELSIHFDGGWVSKCDVGGESEQKDEGDRRKASFSDALKRAAVQWGIGRYLYRLDGVWCEYDSQRKQLKGTPKLPAWALPKGSAPAPQQAAAQPGNGVTLADADMLRQVHRALQKADKLWEASLKWAAGHLPEGFEEPETENEAATLSVPKVVAEKILEKLGPKYKAAPVMAAASDEVAEAYKAGLRHGGSK
jgi:hypothetical protein